MVMEVSIRESGRTGTSMAKDFRNTKAGRCILENSKMDGDTEEASYTNKTGSILLCTKMEFSLRRSNASDNQQKSKPSFYKPKHISWFPCSAPTFLEFPLVYLTFQVPSN